MEVRVERSCFEVVLTRAFCSMTTLLDYKTTLAYLAYLGYPQTQPYLINYSSSSRALAPPTTTALHITKPRKSERKRGKVTRNVFLCYVCGAAGSGKTSLLRAFQGQQFSSIFEPTTKPISVVNSVEINGAEKYLVVSRTNPSPPTSPNPSSTASRVWVYI